MSDRAAEIAAEEEFDFFRDLMEESSGVGHVPSAWYGDGILEDDYSEESTP